MSLGFDERCAADLAGVIDGRALASGEASWLTRAVVGAMRPNRDKPFWDLAHLLGALAERPSAAASPARALIDMILDPRLARSDALAAALRARYPELVDDRGIVAQVGGEAWRATWVGAARLLALAEFVLTADDLGRFAEVSQWLEELDGGSSDSVAQLTRRFVRLAGAYRQAHMPLAPVEKRFRAILAFLAQGAPRRDHGAFEDDDIVAYWRHEIDTGERTQFRTVAEHFVTYSRLTATMGGLSHVRGAVSLEAIEGWADRLDGALEDIVSFDEPATVLAGALAALPDTPKVLTGAERDDLIDLVWLEPFHRQQPLTVLRAVSFGRVQSGIANRLRRGGGGAAVEERVHCGEAAPYETVVERARDLAGHVERMVRIAAALRLGRQDVADDRVAAVLAAAEADIKRVRRAGFDADRAALADAFAKLDDTLVKAAEEVAAFIGAAAALARRRPLAAAFLADKDTFAAAFHEAYSGKVPHAEAARPIAD